MSNDKLIRMANQIASFFQSYPEDQAVTGIRDHIVAFWTPKMRTMLLARAASADQALEPLVVKALLTFQTGKSPIEKEIVGPDEVGQLGSDAG